jgi:hypothetical protein
MKMVKGIKEALYIERRIPILHAPPESANTIRGQHSHLSVVDEAQHFRAGVEGAANGKDAPASV